MLQRPRGPFCGVVNGVDESVSLTLPQCQQQSLSCVVRQKTARTPLAPEVEPPDPEARGSVLDQGLTNDVRGPT